MILLTITYGGNVIRLSNRTAPLEHQWHGEILRIDPIQIKCNKEYGGWLRVSQPTITLSPSLFTSAGLIGVMPPPLQLQASLSATVSDEASATHLCSGVLMLSRWTETLFEYELYSSPYFPVPSEGEMLSVQYSFNGSEWHNAYQDSDRFLRTSLDGGVTWSAAVQFLIPGGTSLASWAPSANLVSGFFANIAAVLGLTLDSTYASSADPLISGNVSGDTLVLDVADAVAAYFNHYFYISGSSLVLVNAELGVGTPYDFGRFDYIRAPQYAVSVPVNKVSDSSGQSYIVGNTLFGQVINVGSGYYGSGNTYLKKIAEYYAKPQVQLSAMQMYSEFLAGRTIRWTDNRLPQELTGAMVMRGMQIDFNQIDDKVTFFGEAVFE